MAKASVITSRSSDFPRWYQDVVAKAELADNGPVRGTMVIRPYGYAIWERMQHELDGRIKALGVQNAYFPLFIPESYLHKEAEHVEGFSPELAVVTHGGGKKLEEAVVVRPTSETIINSYFAKWVQSWRDLPMMINQWSNVVRWEMRPRLFLRTSEFLWQEGHTVQATEEKARRFALRVLNDVYTDFMLNVMALPVFAGRKTQRERFAGANTSWACEAMMGDGKALQMGTSHELGQNFSRAFGIEFQSETGESVYGWQTSWGVSTRLVGGLIMAHGDDAGLRIPPRLAPVQAVVLLVRDEEGSGEKARRLADDLSKSGVRVAFDGNTDSSFGRRVTDWELKGVPLRIEAGPRELVEAKVVLARRDTGTKEAISLDGINRRIAETLDRAQASLAEEAARRQASRTRTVFEMAEVVEACEDGFARIPWSKVGEDGEAKLAERGLSVRCLQGAGGGLPVPWEGDAELMAIVGKAY